MFLPLKTQLRKYLRVFATGLSFVVFGVSALAVGIVFRGIDLLPLSNRTKKNWIKSTIHIGCMYYVRMMRVMGLLTYRFDTQCISAFTHSNPSQGAVVVANHPTLLDAVYMLAAHKNLTCIVKSALSRNFFTATIVRLAGYLPNDAEAFMDIAVAKLHDGENLLIFPEGTRTKNDDKLDFKRGAANIVIAANCPIIPVFVTCAPRTLQKGAKWYNVPSSTPLVTLTAMPPLALSDCIDVKKVRTLQYRHFTSFLSAYYQEGLSKVVQ